MKFHKIWSHFQSRIIWRQRDDSVYNMAKCPIEKPHQVLWNPFLDYGRLEWQITLKDLAKSPNVVYQYNMRELISTWCVRGFIVTRSNLDVIWMIKLHIRVITWVPLELGCMCSFGGCILLCNWMCLVCAPYIYTSRNDFFKPPYFQSQWLMLFSTCDKYNYTFKTSYYQIL